MIIQSEINFDLPAKLDYYLFTLGSVVKVGGDGEVGNCPLVGVRWW